jgi:hypothetical protein
MTAPEIAARLADPLWTNQAVTPDRIAKAQELAKRSHVRWQAVLEALPKKIRAKVEAP